MKKTGWEREKKTSEVFVPGLVLVGMRLDSTGGDFPNFETVMKLLMPGLVARENLGKIWEKFGTGRDYSVSLGKFLNGLEMGQEVAGLECSGREISRNFPEFPGISEEKFGTQKNETGNADL